MLEKLTIKVCVSHFKCPKVKCSERKMKQVKLQKNKEMFGCWWRKKEGWAFYREAVFLPDLGWSACWLIAHSMNSSSITMLGMCAIFGHSSPFSLSHRCFRRGQHLIIREERVVGKPSSGKYWRLGQSKIINLLREVRCWKPLSDFGFAKDAIVISVRVGGSNASSGKDSTSLQLSPSIQIPLRECRSCNPRENSLSQ